MSRSRISLTSVTAVVVLLAIAIAIVISVQTKDNLLAVMVALLIVGGYVTALGLSKRLGEGSRLRKSDGNYHLFWGNLMLVFAILVLVDHYYPGNFVWLVVVFIVWMAFAILLFTIRPKGK
ncbi:MAG: hypothetical protein A4E32_01833 [Methanomassiliicoccales archaeon PtaU1.Bin124]|nr:MAG: hypothetical protein A4E32_01833 [Methanomassiliicoccales archaeon PtaU1.Bin124]